MRHRTRTVVTTIAVAMIAAAAGTATARASGGTDPPGERRAEAAYTDGHRRQAHVSQTDAEHTALTAQPGTIVDSHLETEQDGLRWEVKTTDGRQVWEIRIDPTSGAVMSDRPDE